MMQNLLRLSAHRSGRRPGAPPRPHEEVSPEAVARNVVSAVEKGRRHVRMPKRTLLYPLLVEAPRRITEWLLIGVKA